MLEYIQIKLNTPEDINTALQYKDTELLTNDSNYLCYEIAIHDYVYSYTTTKWDVLVKDFKEFNHVILLVNMGVPVDKVLEVLND